MSICSATTWSSCWCKITVADFKRKQVLEDIWY
jgi:hypothetical protein